MCQFNFIVTKDNSNYSEISKIVKEFGLNFRRIELDIQTSEEVWAFLTTTKDCDCGSILGKKYNDNSTNLELKKEKKKLERKRFSKTRIELLLKQKQKKLAVETEKENMKETEEAQVWINLVNDKRLKNTLNEIGIFHHYFSGELTNEKIKFTNQKIVSVDKIDFNYLREIGASELNWIKL